MSEGRGARELGEIGEGIKQKKKTQTQTPLIDTDTSLVITRGEGGWGQVEEGKWGNKWVMEGD